MKPTEWKCDICGEIYEYKDWSLSSTAFPGEGPNLYEEHPERFCFRCYANGIMWAMKQANKKSSS